MRAFRFRVRLAVLLAGSTLVTVGCTSTPPASDPGPTPDATVTQFATAWQGLKTDTIANLTSDPGSATEELTSVLKNLAPTKVAVTAGNVKQTDPLNATSSASFVWTLAKGVTWKYTANWAFTRTATTSPWKAQWAATLINPKLGEGQTMVLRTTDAANGVIVDRKNQQIQQPVTVYSVVALPGKVGDVNVAAAALTKILGKLDPTVTPASVVAGLKIATPATGYTVTNLREADYETVRSQLNTIPGLTFPSTTRNLPPVKDFAKLLLSEAEPVANKLMAGKPGWEIDSIDATGAELETLASQAATPGPNVTLTLDTAIQEAAEKALAGTPEPAMIVAIQPSTGEILAVAQNQPANALGPLALTGEYPPGSTFKIVTATAGFDNKLITPTTQVDCPGVVTIDSREIHNEGFELGTVPVTTAFAKSCNTTFAQLATQMPVDALTKAATQYGIGRDFVIPGITTLTGRVPVADSTVQKAEDGFGQGVVLVTPFSAALMAATAATGNMPMPSLIRGAKTTVDQPAPARSAATQTGVKTLMRAVVTDGTALILQDAGTVYAKTGTADFVDAKGVDKAHAWTVGFRGDLAFSVLIVAGDTSKRTNVIADQFLKAVPSS
ncbi:cell division protein FtsI/penicillin-binding protein 2 [Nakamurella sp. UYEF19]|uniref:penicillin-binding transpeptidase domain-containing protein n=1 Tax=Nakamurella sp. UYEF19 TaxID=1756392 RepID=UPI003397CE82